MTWEGHARNELFPMLRESSVNVSICPSPGHELDPKFCLELGASIMLGLPIIVWLPDDRPIPAGLRRVAHRIVRGDPSSDFGQTELLKAIESARRDSEPHINDSYEDPDTGERVPAIADSR